MKNYERGFAILTVVVVTTLMMVIAVASLDFGLNLKMMASAVSYSQRTMMAADAGAKWAQGALPALVYPNGAAGAMEMNAILALAPLDKSDSMCLSWEDCSRYRLMTTQGPVPFGQGTYRVAVTCYPASCTVTPMTFQIRSEGTLANNQRSVVEVDCAF